MNVAQSISTTPSKIGLLLVNLGSPDAPTKSALKKYLAEFLSDPRVIDLPRWKWLPVLHGIILNTRPKASAKLYQSIWQADGSPLIATSTAIADKLAIALNQQTDNVEIEVKLAMRYGNPSLTKALQQFSNDGIENIVVMPLFPQYSASTSASVFDAVAKHFKNTPVLPNVLFIRDYCKVSGYIELLAEHIKKFWADNGRNDKLIFSYHGLPQRYIEQGDIYYQHCQYTTLETAKKLGLAEDEFIMTFQSRFGPEEWIKPYTDETLTTLAQNGLKSVDIISPAFAADCLETLEELAVLNKNIFLNNGGQSYQYIPALNDSDKHVTFLASVVINKLQSMGLS